jgi:hypothetical protein
MAWLGEAMKIARYYRKTLFWMFALMGLIVVSTSVIYVHTVDQQLSDDYLRSSRAIARAIANSNIDLIVAQNYSALQSIIDQYVEIPGIAYVFVVDDKGAIIAHTFVPGVPSEITADYKDGKDVRDRTLAGLGNFSEVTAGIVAGEAGSVHVGMDNRPRRAAGTDGHRQGGLSSHHHLCRQRAGVLRADVSGLVAAWSTRQLRLEFLLQ